MSEIFRHIGFGGHAVQIVVRRHGVDLVHDRLLRAGDAVALDEIIRRLPHRKQRGIRPHTGQCLFSVRLKIALAQRFPDRHRIEQRAVQIEYGVKKIHRVTPYEKRKNRGCPKAIGQPLLYCREEKMYTRQIRW